MSNFVKQEDMVEIFGENLLDRKDMLNYFLELLGKTESKPFECVGTIDEVLYSVNNIILNYEGKLPYLLKYYKENYKIDKPNTDVITNINKSNVSDEFIEKIKGALYD